MSTQALAPARPGWLTCSSTRCQFHVLVAGLKGLLLLLLWEPGAASPPLACPTGVVGADAVAAVARVGDGD